MSHQKTKIFSDLSENLKLVVDQLKKDRDERPGREVQLEEFWKEYEQNVTAVSSECTKICLAFSSGTQPSSSGCEMFRERIESAVLRVVSTVYKLPKSKGQTLHKKIFDHTCNIVFAVQELALVVGQHAQSTSNNPLQYTGRVWELCESVASLPKDSRYVALGVFAETVDLVQDALSELEDSLRMTDAKEESYDEEYEDFDNIGKDWSDTDKSLCQAFIGLIKTTKSVFKKCQAALKKQPSTGDGVKDIEDLEMCIERSKQASPSIDEIIEDLYPPLNSEDVLAKSNILVGSLRSFLGVIPNMYFIGEEDIAWIQFLGKAVEHNWTKVETSSLTS